MHCTHTNFLTTSFHKETTDFLCKIYDICHSVTPRCLVVAIDVNSQHTNILHTDEMEDCRLFLKMNTTVQTLTNDIPTLLDFIQSFCILRKAVSAHLWQSHGYKNARIYANILMHYFKNTFFHDLIYHRQFQRHF